MQTESFIQFKYNFSCYMCICFPVPKYKGLSGLFMEKVHNVSLRHIETLSVNDRAT